MLNTISWASAAGFTGVLLAGAGVLGSGRTGANAWAFAVDVFAREGGPASAPDEFRVPMLFAGLSGIRGPGGLGAPPSGAGGGSDSGDGGVKRRRTAVETVAAIDEAVGRGNVEFLDAVAGVRLDADVAMILSVRARTSPQDSLPARVFAYHARRGDRIATRHLTAMLYSGMDMHMARAERAVRRMDLRALAALQARRLRGEDISPSDAALNGLMMRIEAGSVITLEAIEELAALVPAIWERVKGSNISILKELVGLGNRRAQMVLEQLARLYSHRAARDFLDISDEEEFEPSLVNQPAHEPKGNAELAAAIKWNDVSSADLARIIPQAEAVAEIAKVLKLRAEAGDFEALLGLIEAARQGRSAAVEELAAADVERMSIVFGLRKAAVRDALLDAVELSINPNGVSALWRASVDFHRTPETARLGKLILDGLGEMDFSAYSEAVFRDMHYEAALVLMQLAMISAQAEGVLGGLIKKVIGPAAVNGSEVARNILTDLSRYGQESAQAILDALPPLPQDRGGDDPASGGAMAN